LLRCLRGGGVTVVSSAGCVSTDASIDGWCVAPVTSGRSISAFAAGDFGIADDEDVLRLEIAVDDAARVGRADRARDLPAQPQRRDHRDHAEPLQPAIERLAVE
jgi:hypothetical protein